jgi:hypothetical protein
VVVSCDTCLIHLDDAECDSEGLLVDKVGRGLFFSVDFVSELTIKGPV